MKKLLQKMIGKIGKLPATQRCLAAGLLLLAGGQLMAQTTFNYTGAVQTYTVPVGCTSITVDAYGGAGFGLQGYGGSVQATHPVTPGEVLNVYVGGTGSETAGGFNGGGNPGSNTGYAGGGGASDIRRGGNTLNDRIIVAGGGGGSGSNCGTWTAEGGHGGGLTGGSGCLFSCSDCQYTGSGGTQAAGGIAGPTSHTYCTGNTNGSFGIGGSNTVQGYGSGGGGGYYGGGSGCFEGAGGGSSYTSPLATSVTHTQGVRQGNGMIVITPVISAPCTSPSNVTASPPMICLGSTADMNATSAGNTIQWYTVPVGGVSIGSSASGANFAVSPSVTTIYYAEAVGTVCSPSTRTAVTVTVDNVAPVANCQAITVTLDANGNASTTASAVNNGSTDNCTIASSALSQTSFTCNNAGTNSVTLTVTDNNGNTATCATTIFVMGANPTASVAADTTVCGFNVGCNGGSDGVATATAAGGCGTYTYMWNNGGNTATVTGLVAGTYMVTVTDIGGGSTVQTVTVTEPSALQGSSTTTQSCAGDSTGSIDMTYTGGNNCQALTYAWSNGASTEDLQNLAPGSYTVTVSDVAGCTSTTTVVVAAFAVQTPTFTQNGNDLTCNGGFTGFQWLLNGNNISGATSNTYSVTQSGTYSVMAVDSNGCSAVSDTLFVTFVGIGNAMGEWSDLSIYPNPAKDQFKLRTAAPIGYAIKVTVTDMFGRSILVKSLPQLGDEVAFDLKALAAGTYMVEVTSEQGQRKTFKLAVQ